MRKWRIMGFVLMALGAITLLLGPGWQAMHTPAAESYRIFVLVVGATMLLSGTALALFSWGGPTQEDHPDITKS